MIFKPELAKLVMQGRKSMTRRPVKPGEKHCRYQAGKSYALQPGRGKQAAGRLTILEVRREALGAISLADARREGFRTTQDFKDYWAAMYGRFDALAEVWVISFVKGEQTDEPRFLAARPGAPSGDYTTNRARAMRNEGEAVSVKDQERFAKEGEERDKARREDQKNAALKAIDGIIPYAHGKEHKRLREAAHRIRSIGLLPAA